MSGYEVQFVMEVLALAGMHCVESYASMHRLGLRFSGRGVQEYTLCIDGDSVQLQTGITDEVPMVIETTPGVWLQIARGETTGVDAARAGKLHIAGNLPLVDDLADFMVALRPDAALCCA